MKESEVKRLEQELGKATAKEKKRRRRHKAVRILATILFALLLLVMLCVIGIAVLSAVGKRSLQKKGKDRTPTLQDAYEEGEADQAQAASGVYWQEGWVRYDGKIYEYNEDILTFLVMGIDKKGEVRESADAVSGGQSDALFLVVLNPDEESIKIIAVNRDTMTDIRMYGFERDGQEMHTTAQIAVQHGYGDGKSLSCELTKNAVSDLFYGLPIHGYAAVNMEAIPILNDAVGGVDVTVPEDLTWIRPGWTEGSEIHLEGEDAYLYVHHRDIAVFESARGRLFRQKQYLNAFGRKALDAVKADIRMPLVLYGQLDGYIVTDLTTDEIAYLAGRIVDYSFDGENIYTLEGETVMGKTYEEFYPDKEALRSLMIEVFYREVEIDGPQ